MYQIALTNQAGDILCRLTGGADGQVWETVEQARVHIGVRLSESEGRIFIIDEDQNKVEEIYPDTPAQLAKHDEYDAYMAPERAERRAESRKRLMARAETARLEKQFAL